MYYQDVSLFKSTATLDRCLMVLTSWFEVPREALHVIGTPKGLVCGALFYLSKNGEAVDLGLEDKVNNDTDLG